MDHINSYFINDPATIESRISTFWEQQEKFRDHPLPTELSNHDTYNLSELAKFDPIKGARAIFNIDLKTVQKLKKKVQELEQLRADILKTIKNGNKVYICGCGASGRLAVCLEYLWRTQFSEKARDSLIGFLAGGDNAMIKSLEGFEDHKDLGIKQLYLAGFKRGDLLISTTASGESPFAIGAVEEAARVSIKPWFIHCNTNEALAGRIKDHVIYNSKVNTMSLFVGQMALSGSTRMQATTALMLGIGLPLFYENINKALDALLEVLEKVDFAGLEDFIVREADIYQSKEFVLYDTPSIYGITVLTDTTERSPTFNLTPFENQLDPQKKPAFCYLLFFNADTPENAWNALLGRKPRTLEWTKETSLRNLMGFDFSKNIVAYRSKYASPSHYFRISKEKGFLHLSLDELKKQIDISNLSPLFEQLLLKLILNTCSTLVMGRLGFYEGNLMTSLYPSNSKLIDRAIRYINFILRMKYNIILKYEVIAENMFVELKKLSPHESIVLKTVEKLKKKNKKEGT